MGDGTSISIWDDYWLLRNNSCKIQSLKISNMNYVSQLFLPNSKLWNLNLISTSFNPIEAQKSLCAHCKCYCAKYVGLATKVYSEKSGYKLLVSGLASSTNEGYNGISTEVTNFYRLLWHITGPSKLKITIWRFYNFIPTKENLHLKRTTSNAMCPRCGDARETITHVILDCHLIRES